MKVIQRLIPLVLALACAASPAELYLTVTGANVRKAKIAVGSVHALPDAGQIDAAFARKVRDQVQSDLELAGLFEFVSPSLFASFDQARDVRTINYSNWETLQAAFVLKLGYKISAGKLVLEALFYDVPGKKRIFATRYQYPATQYPRLVHAMTEDILKAITGEKGLFASRILMICRDLRRRRSPPKEVYIMDPDGRNVKQLTFDQTLSLSPSWAPNGRYITYTQYEFHTYKGIRKKGTSLKKHDLQTGNRVLLSAKEGMNSGASWSPDGSKIAATLSFTGRPEIYFLNPNGIGEPEPFSRRVQWRKLSGEGFQASSESLLFDVEPSWAPDGKRLVLSSARTGHPMIYTVDLTTMAATQLTFAGTYNASPAWSPKADKIIFAAQRLAEGNFDLYMIDPDGNNLTRLTIGDRSGRRHGVNSENPSWAPTGRHIAFANNEGGNYGIYVMNVDGSAKRKISPPDKECTEPAWGPAED